MYRTAELIDRLKAAHNITSDYALAKKLGVTRQAVSKYRNKLTSFDDKVAYEISELLGLNPAVVVASMHVERAERAHDENLISFWQKFAA